MTSQADSPLHDHPDQPDQPGDVEENLPAGKRGQGSEMMTPEELAFVRAVDDYKRSNDRPFPALREILQILKSLGYKKVIE